MAGAGEPPHLPVDLLIQAVPRRRDESVDGEFGGWKCAEQLTGVVPTS
jgi:hypothetical protein